MAPVITQGKKDIRRIPFETTERLFPLPREGWRVVEKHPSLFPKLIQTMEAESIARKFYNRKLRKKSSVYIIAEDGIKKAVLRSKPGKTFNCRLPFPEEKPRLEPKQAFFEFWLDGEMPKPELVPRVRKRTLMELKRLRTPGKKLEVVTETVWEPEGERGDEKHVIRKEWPKSREAAILNIVIDLYKDYGILTDLWFTTSVSSEDIILKKIWGNIHFDNPAAILHWLSKEGIKFALLRSPASILDDRDKREAEKRLSRMGINLTQEDFAKLSKEELGWIAYFTTQEKHRAQRGIWAIIFNTGIKYRKGASGKWGKDTEDRIKIISEYCNKIGIQVEPELLQDEEISGTKRIFKLFACARDEKEAEFLNCLIGMGIRYTNNTGEEITPRWPKTETQNVVYTMDLAKKHGITLMTPEKFRRVIRHGIKTGTLKSYTLYGCLLHGNKGMFLGLLKNITKAINMKGTEISPNTKPIKVAPPPAAKQTGFSYKRMKEEIARKNKQNE